MASDLPDPPDLPPDTPPLDADLHHDLDLAGVLQWVGLGMLLAFVTILLKVLLPPALLQPAWQLQVAEALRGGASVPLVGAVLLLLAERLDPEGEDLAWLVAWVRRLAILAAIGYLLLIPLQVSAGLRQLGQTSGGEERQLRSIQRAAAAIERAETPAALNQAIASLPGLPPGFRGGSFAQPLPAVRAILLEQIRPLIRRVETRLQELRNQRLQGAVGLFLLDGLTALGYGIGFAALGRGGEDQPTLLQRFLLLPEELRGRFPPGSAAGAADPPFPSEPLP